MENEYPTQKLLRNFVPIRDVLSTYPISEEKIMSLVKDNKLMYALFKDPIGHKRIPHINIEQLKSLKIEGVPIE